MSVQLLARPHERLSKAFRCQHKSPVQVQLIPLQDPGCISMQCSCIKGKGMVGNATIYESKSWWRLFTPSSYSQLHQTLGYPSSVHQGVSNLEYLVSTVEASWVLGCKLGNFRDPSTRLQCAWGVLLPTFWAQIHKSVREQLIFSESLPAQETHKVKLLMPWDHCCARAGHQQERFSFVTLTFFIIILHLPERLPQVLILQLGTPRSPPLLITQIHWSLLITSLKMTATSAKTRYQRELSSHKSNLLLKDRLKKQHSMFKTKGSPFLASLPHGSTQVPFVL